MRILLAGENTFFLERSTERELHVFNFTPSRAAKGVRKSVQDGIKGVEQRMNVPRILLRNLSLRIFCSC